MGLTIVEKILQHSLVDGTLERGSRIGVKAHQTLGHDLNAVMTFLALHSMGVKRLQTEVSVQYVDHNMIQADFKNSDDHSFLRTSCSKLGVIYARPGSGICHQLHLEHFSTPGKVLVGGDSHTTAAGGIGMLSFGVGGFDGAVVMAGGPLYLTMPKIVRVYLTGKLPHMVSSKNVILEILRRLSVKGAVGKILEFAGPGVATLNVAERSTITNMGTETGATTSIFPSDEHTKQWMRAFNREADWIELHADADAVYDEQIDINLSELEPLIACPASPDKIVKVRDVVGTKIDQVMLGSCTNTALNDVMAIANILKGRTIHPNVDVALYPSTRTVLRESIQRGALDEIVESGVRIFEAICGGCNGCGFAPKTSGVSLRTTPRNFQGRSGTKDDAVYLCAPETAAISAVMGEISDPRDFDIPEFSFSLPEKFVDPGDIFIYPSENPEDVEIYYGPNIQPIPAFPALPEHVEKNVLMKLPDNITTDHICPAGALYLPIRSNIPEISKHAFKVLDEEFATKAQAKQGGILVAGENYGQGSSREQAALVPRYLQIVAVIAKSYARLHLANMVNWGLLPLLFTSDADYQRIAADDVLIIDTTQLEAGKDLPVYNKSQDYTFNVATPLVQFDIDVIKQGGRINGFKD